MSCVEAIVPIEVVFVLVFIIILLNLDYRAWWLRIWSAVQGLRRRSVVRKIPGPLALPMIGTRWLFKFGPYKINKVHEAYKDLYKKYGPVVREESVGLKIHNCPVISLFAAEDIEKVLSYPSKYPVRPPTEVIAYYRSTRPDRYTNLGLVNEQGETWLKLKSSLTPALTSPATMSRFLPELNQVADDFNSLLLSSRDSNNIVHSFEELANRMGLESTCTLILGRRMGFLEHTLDPTAARLAQAVQCQFCASRDTFFGLPFWKIFPTSAYRKLVKSEDMFYNVISELVDLALKEEMESCETDAVKSVFMHILQSPNLDIRDKKSGIIDFIAGGIKTLGNTLVFLLYLIAKHPRVQKKLYDEIVSLAPIGTPVTSQVINDAPYLRACIKEANRILPTAPCVARVLETDMYLSGHHIKKGSVVLCQTWIASQQEENFKYALEFVPERWLTNERPCPCISQQSQHNEVTTTSQPEEATSVNHHISSQTSQPTHHTSSHTSPSTRECFCDVQGCRINPFLVIPFGVGPRMCPGKRFVHFELQVVLAQTVRQFEIFYEGELDLQFEFLLAPAANTDFILKDRN